MSVPKNHLFLIPSIIDIDVLSATIRFLSIRLVPYRTPHHYNTPLTTNLLRIVFPMIPEKQSAVRTISPLKDQD